MIKTVTDMLNAQPFVPFILVMNSGERYEVRHEQMAVIEDEILTIYRPKSDRHDMLWVFQVSSIEILDPEE